MSLLRHVLDGQTPWLSDRGAETPAAFSPAPRERELLAESAGLVDLTHTGMVRVAGVDRVTLIHGLITNQIRKVSASQALYALLLTPQGRHLWDFTILERDDGFLLLTEPDRVEELARKITLYVLRAKVTVSNVTGASGVLVVAGPGADGAVAAACPGVDPADGALGRVWDAGEGALLWRDPRHAAFGWRLLAPAPALPAWWQRLAARAAPVGFSAWEEHRIRHGLPRGGCELVPDETLPLEAGMVEMNAIDFGKGCYVGQETTARTNYRGTVKRRLFQWRLPQGDVVPGAVVLTQGGREAGSVTSVAREGEALVGLAMLRVSDVAERELFLDGQAVLPRKPEWAAWE